MHKSVRLVGVLEITDVLYADLGDLVAAVRR
jgi:hypothetical protein